MDQRQPRSLRSGTLSQKMSVGADIGSLDPLPVESRECFMGCLANDQALTELQEMLTLGIGEPPLKQQQEVDHPARGLYHASLSWGCPL